MYIICIFARQYLLKFLKKIIILPVFLYLLNIYLIGKLKVWEFSNLQVNIFILMPSSWNF